MKKFLVLSKFNIFVIFLVIAVIFFPTFLPTTDVSAKEINANANKTNVASKLYNTVVFLTFEREQNCFPENFFNDVHAMYETANVGVKNYFLKQSLNKFEVCTTLLYDNGNCIRSDNPLEYYKPRYKWINGSYTQINELGYDNRYFNLEGEAVDPKQSGAKCSIEGGYREQQLIREVLSKCDLPSGFNSDFNGDGKVDSLVVITDVSAQADWGDVLWSHMSYIHTFSDNVISGYYVGEDINVSDLKNIKSATLGGSDVYSYNMISLNQLTATKVGDFAPAVSQDEKHLYNVGILCHELLHNVGVYDYYSYEDATYESVGEFDVMASTGVVPQYMLAFNRQKLGWLNYENLLYVNDSGDYTLKPVSTGDGALALKIVLSNYIETGEYFMAEFRNQNGATSDNPFDGGLSGSGLIIYRVNEKNAYINASGMQSLTNLGNMYGDDEIYVYRMGNVKSLNDPTGYTSYSLLGNSLPPVMTDFTKYDNTTFGNSDKSLSIGDLSSSLTENSETIIHYTNGSNSGIVFSNVKILETGEISFHVELPEKQGSMPILNSKDVFISRFLNGERRLYWNTSVKSGDAYILVLRSTERLKSLAEKGSSHIAFDDFKNGSFSHYTTLYSAKLPLAEKYAVIPEFDEEALVFIALESQNGNCSVRYVDCITNPNENFSQYLVRLIDPLYIYVAVIVLLVVLALLTYFILGKKGQYKRKK